MVVPLTSFEIGYAQEALGRRLTREELVLLEAEWSEHCSYKSAREELKRLKTKAPLVIVGPGRDAGAIKLFDDVAIIARIESHNHPSALDPYNGAATGVGGIVRDVISLGARPVLLADALYMGSGRTRHSRWLSKNIIRGISDYGNRLGIPTATGLAWFSEAYEKQPLINVACVGIAKLEGILPGSVKPGDPIIMLGNTTGRDGFLGSSFASKPLDESDVAAIQVGNPFIEKLIIEALTEAFDKKLVSLVKDLGGGGLGTAIVETAAQNGVGVVIRLDRVHLREPDLEPFEIIASESQERMIVVPRNKGALGELFSIFDKYGLEYSVIGYFSKERKVKILFRGLPVVDLPVGLAVSPPKTSLEVLQREPCNEEVSMPHNIKEAVVKVLSSPRVSLKAVIYEQYDWGVGGRTSLPPGYGDSAVIWLMDNTKRGFAVAVRGNPGYTRLDPFVGATISFAEAYRRVASVGAEPLAALDNINSGNPEKPEQHYYTLRMIEGIAHASQTLNLPVIGGNVSLYNEDESGSMIDPVASVLVIGRIEDVTKALTTIPVGGSPLVLAGDTKVELGGSEVQRVLLGRSYGKPPEFKPTEEKRLGVFAKEVSEKGIASAAHSVSLGGVVAAAFKMAYSGGVGVTIESSAICDCDPLEALFSESQARILYEVKREKLQDFLSLANAFGVKAGVIGNTLKDERLFRLMHRGNKIIELGFEDVSEALEGLERVI